MSDTPRIEELKRRVHSDPASIAFAALAEEYRRAGRFEEAIATCIAGLQRHPSYLSAHVTLGRALIEVNRFEDAREELEYVLKLAPENLAAIRGLAEIHHRRGDDPHERYDAPAEDAGPVAAAEEFQPSRRAAPPAPPAAAAPIDIHVFREPAAAEPPEALAWQPPARPEPPAAPAPIAVTAFHETGGIPETPVPTRPLEEPALAGLEEFLTAIRRARAEGLPARR